ncbi:DUF2219 domain-containing protein [Helicobacter didelphidarum]|uniref:DUF2219 domain-containing protein n=1 Tax=Helicobacter didelphidarum TaxID=2040648 RepID=A0A3D8IMC3_9HELI|nr:lipid A deacylase LpxR family protein [Helicobacter didelphidarum]RDU66076.1 DUF2219 domain-containing protein [Helicobacter didelphidarum]
MFNVFKFILLFLVIDILHARDIVAYKKQTFSLATDNDAYFEPTNYDRFYTAGHSLSYTSKEFQQSFLHYVGISSFLSKNLSLTLPYSSVISRFSINLAQEIYTPNSKYVTIPPKDDMPYGGYLYANFMAQNRIGNFMEQASLNIGLVGPYALAKETQDIIHILTNVSRYAGWDSQIHNEFIFNLYYKAMYKIPIIENIIEFLPFGTIALGNAHTHVDFGARLRIGWGLWGDFGIQKAHTNNLGSTSIDDNFRFYLSGGILGRVVGRNIFIQGNTIGGVQTSLDVNHFIYEAELGMAIAWKGFVAGVVYTYKQKEFLTQARDSNYTTLRIEVSF